jgi:cellulose synthase/poly-beta-1,6-N-acetylglucosamine synthase-like glycosyltransferase
MIALTVALIAYVAVALAYWLGAIYALLRTARAMPLLSDLAPPQPERWPALSVVVAACNEADRVEAAVRTLLEENYPDLEILLVDDRSTDATGEILDRLAAEDDRARVIHITRLPDGWLGKVNALARGLEASRGDYVLFTDADVHVAPGTLRQSVAWCEDQGLDHLAAFPTVWRATVLVDATVSVFIRQFVLATRPWKVADPESKGFIGVGAFNLVRRAAFEATEGFAWLRLEVADDAGLGSLMKRSGARCGVVAAFGLVSLHWYRSLGEVARGAEKAYASASGCSLLRTLSLALVSLALEMSPILALVPLAFHETRLVGCGGIAVLTAFVASVLVMTRWGRAEVLPALIAPAVMVLGAAVFVRAGLLGWWRGGVLWRGTLYPSAALRAGRRIRLM